METLVKLVVSFLKLLVYFFEGDSEQDRYLHVGAKPSTDEKKVVPFARTDVPHLGDDHEKMVKQAEQLYSNDDLRHKWLMAVHRLRTTETGWIMDKSNNEKKFKKWGLTHLSC